MALLADKSADANSNLVGAPSSQAKTFTMPGGVAIKVESVVATVNNGAGSAVTPELTIRDQSGAVIATTKQDDAVPAGDTGTATYALRLGGAKGGIRFGKVNTGTFLDVRTTTTGPSGFGVYAESASGINFVALTGQVLIQSNAALMDLDTAGGNFIAATAGGTMTLSSGGGNVTIDSGHTTETLAVNTHELSISNDRLAFFGKASVTQQPTPVVLADVIALLQAYGFCP